MYLDDSFHTNPNGVKDVIVHKGLEFYLDSFIRKCFTKICFKKLYIFIYKFVINIIVCLFQFAINRLFKGNFYQRFILLILFLLLKLIT